MSVNQERSTSHDSTVLLESDIPFSPIRVRFISKDCSNRFYSSIFDLVMINSYNVVRIAAPFDFQIIYQNLLDDSSRSPCIS